MNILLNLSFVGTNYCGWQVQKNAVSVQEILQNSLEMAFGRRYPVTGCSRTDSGVHANEFYCAVKTDNSESKIPLEKLPQVLNTFLPYDIAVKGASEVPEDFHPRYDAVQKEYLYIILNSSNRNPFLHQRAFMYPKKLDLSKMREAAAFFIGRHSFSSCMASGSKTKDCVRDIKYINIASEDDLIKIYIAADGFLYNMVRIITGTLVDASSGNIHTEDIPSFIKKGERRDMGFTAPSCGLYLNKVIY